MQKQTHTNSHKWGAPFLFGVLLLAASSFVRLISYPTITSDYTYFTAKWFDALQSHAGLTAFLYPFSDYAPMYLYLLKILTFFPVYSLWSVKTLSIIFDVGVAYLVYRLLKDTTNYSRERLFLAFAIIMSLPTVVLNSSLWGQSDAVYTMGIVASLYFIIRDNPRWAAIAFGLGISFKLQAIFFLPILLGYFWRNRAQWKELVWIPLVYFVSAIPAWIGGASVHKTLLIYANQSSEYTSLNVSSPSLFAFIEKLSLSAQAQGIAFWIGLLLASLFALVSMYSVWRAPHRADILVFLSVWCVLLIPLFLPRMHERYFYLADILSVVYALYVPKRALVAVLVVGASFLAYMPFLSGQVAFFAPVHVDLRIPSAMLVLAVLLLGGTLLSFMRKSIRHAKPRSKLA